MSPASRHGDADLDPWVDELRRAYGAATGCRGGLHRPGAGAPSHDHALVAAFRQQVEGEGGTFLLGGFRPGVIRPYGGLAELVDGVAGRVSELDPDLVQAYGITLANLLPCLGG
ncbi:MAG: hypothetical protein MI919_38285, partial [Holophagales bacterium]|nr:hypothetical protein [Holophagales bacterium]